MSSSSSTQQSATSTSTQDKRMALDGDAVGLSAGGDAILNMVPDEAFALGERALEAVEMIAQGSQAGAFGTSQLVSKTFADVIATTQQNAKTESGQIGEQLVKIGLPIAVIAFAATRIWGR